MSYQKCPICEGTGRVHSYLSMSTNACCNPCRGTGLINELNGLPPAEGVHLFMDHLEKQAIEKFQKDADKCWGLNSLVVDSQKQGVVRVDFLMTKTGFYEAARFILTTRLNDPESTLDDIWNKWVNEKNL